jgi:hypothetical protein
MQTIWGILILILALIAWAGQVISWWLPATAVKLTLMEAEEDVEPAFWADVRGEAAWDALTLWPMVVAGILLIADQPSWAYFGVAGGAIYLYFGGRGILTRAAMLRRGLRIGNQKNVTQGMAFLAIWGIVGLVTIVAGIYSLV